MAILLALLLAVAAVLRFAFLGSMEFWWDEFVTLGRSMPDVPDLLHGLMYQSPNVATDCSPPLHQLIVHCMMYFGSTEFLLKTPAALCGVVTIVFVMLIGKRLFGLRAGFFSAMFCALSLFHVYYSRDIRWYSTFYAVCLGGLYFLVRSLEENRWKHWLLFSAFSTLSLYTSYTAATFLCGETLFILLTVGSAFRQGEKVLARTLVLRAGTALLFTLVLYSPWIPAQYFAFLSFKGKGARVPFEAAFLWDTLRFYLEYFYKSDFNRLWIAAPLCLFGLISGIFFRKLGREILLVSCWALVPLVGVYSVKTEFGVSPKYVMSLFYYFAFCLGLGLDGLARLAERKAVPFGRFTGNIAAFIVFILAIASNFHYMTFYQGKTYSHKALMRDLALNATSDTHILYDKPSGLSFVGYWYLRDAFPSARGHFENTYKRAILVSDTPRSLEGYFPLEDRDKFHLYRSGLVNRSPLTILPEDDSRYVYTDTYKNMRLFSDAWSTDNATIDMAYGGLIPADTTRPGQVVYAFQIPPGVEADNLVVTLVATITRRNLPNSDGFIELLAGNTPETLEPVGRLDVSDASKEHNHRDFRGLFQVEKSWPLDRTALPGKKVFIGLRYSIGSVDGFFTVASFSLAAQCSGKRLEPSERARIEGSTILANLPLRQFPLQEHVLEPGKVLAFSANDQLFPTDSSGRYGSDSQRTAYLAKHPGSRCVFTARTREGVPYLQIYDPWLEPEFPIAADRHTILLSEAPVNGMKVPGVSSPATLDWNGAGFPFSISQPPSSTTSLNPGLGRTVFFRPIFDADHLNPDDFHAFRDIRIKSSESCLTCMGETPCFATYRFLSEFPISRVVTTMYLSMKNDERKMNSLRLSYSANGGPFQEILGVVSSGDGKWGGLNHPWVTEVIVDPPAREIVLRLDMANESSHWVSSSKYPMVVEMYSKYAPPPLVQGKTALVRNTSPKQNPLPLAVSPTPYDAWENLRHGLKLTGIWRSLRGGAN